MIDLVLHMSPVLLGIIVALVLLLASLTVLLFGAIYGPKAKLQRRMNNVIGLPVDAGRSGRSSERSGPGRRRNIEAKLREIERQKKRKKGYRLQEELAQSGLTISSRQYITISVIVGLLPVAIYLFFGLPKIGLPLVAIVGMLGLPKLYLRLRIKKRLARFTAIFADAIDVVVRGVRTGLTVGECLAILGREMPDPVGAEFRALTEGLHLGLSLDECLSRMYSRVPTTELRFFSIVLVMQQSTGGNLAETLEKLSDIIRARKRMRDKIQAFASEAKTSAAIVGSLPIFVALALIFIAPKYIAILPSTDAGKWMIVAGIVWMMIGIFVMAKIIRFDY